jgi:hypothetical protein
MLHISSRILLEHAIFGRLLTAIEEARRGVADFVEVYSKKWRIEKNQSLSPPQAREAYYIRVVHELRQSGVEETGYGTFLEIFLFSG